MSSSTGADVRSLVSTLLLVIAIGAAGFLVGFGLTVLALQVLSSMGIPLQQRPAMVIAVSVLMLQGVGFGSVALGYLYFRRDGFSLLNVRWPRILDLVWFVGGLVGLFAILILINLALLSLGVETAQHELVDIGLQNPEILLVLIPLSILLVGPGEELLFRGVIQQLLRERSGPIGAIALTSVLFSVAHVGALSGEGLLPTLLVYFVLSFLLGSVYEWNGNLVVPALIHGTFNAVQFLLLYVVTRYELAPAVTVF